MKKEKFLLIGNYYYPELTGIGKYNGELIDWLSKHGYQCNVIAPYPYSPYWRVYSTNYYRSYLYKQELKKNEQDIPIKIYRCPHFVPAIPTGLKRVLSDFSFFISAFVQLFFLTLYKKYDYVIIVSPSFMLGFLGLFMKIHKKTRFIYHIQDLQVDAAYELGMVKWKPFVWLMYKLEFIILKKADYVSSISEGMIKKIKQKYDRSVILFPNWVNTASIYPIREPFTLKESFNISVEQKVILYSGAIGEKQGIMGLLEVAKDLLYRKDLIFIICSSGPYFEKLKKIACELKIDNIKFLDLLPIEKYNELLNIADIHLLLQRNNANDLVMPSKLTSILSVGGLVLATAASTTSLYKHIAAYKMGYLIEQENKEILTKSILEMIEKESIELKDNARKYALNYLDIDKILNNFISQIVNLK